MRVVLVIVIAVAWLVILTPSFIRRRAASGETYSISHFHRQLRVLEHSAPAPIVTPAYRLRGAGDSAISDGSGSSLPPVLSVVGARDLPRPALAFLAEDPVGETEPEPFPPGGVPAHAVEPRRRSDADVRRLTRQRRRDTLCVLVLALVSSLMIGFVPGASVAWVASGIFGAALIAYVSLLVHLRRLGEERERKLHYLRPKAPLTSEAQVTIEEGDEAGDFAGMIAVR